MLHGAAIGCRRSGAPPIHHFGFYGVGCEMLQNRSIVVDAFNVSVDSGVFCFVPRLLLGWERKSKPSQDVIV